MCFPPKSFTSKITNPLFLQNVSVAYIGMLVGGDYIFSVLNFVGLNIW